MTTLRIGLFWTSFALAAAKINFEVDDVYDYDIFAPDPTTSKLDGVAPFPVPFHVSVQELKGANTYEHLCGGTIIHEEIIVTAAHCFHAQKNPKRISVVAGSNRLSLGTATRRQVVKIVEHENFDLEALSGRDIALLKLDRPWRFDGQYVDKINFNLTRNIEDAVDGYLVGWGESATEGQDLELVSFQTLDSTTCRRKHHFIYVSATDVCAISYSGRGACTGDSGGALVDKNFKQLYGLLSYGKEPCRRGEIYVFTSMFRLVDWIDKHMKKLLQYK